jgi:hypothetical protein
MTAQTGSRVSHEEYQSMLATIIKLSPVELRSLADGIVRIADTFEIDQFQGDPA